MKYSNSMSRGKFNVILPAILFAFLVSLATHAQVSPQQQEIETDFNDTELKQFATAAGKVMEITQKTQEEMIKIIEEENMELDKFNQILMAQQSQEGEKVDATAEEMAAFNNASQKIMEIQKDVQTDVVEAIEQEGLEPQKYEAIMLAYQSDPEVKAKIVALIQE